MRLLSCLLLAALLLAACNTAYKAAPDTPPAEMQAALSAAQRDSLNRVMGIALSFANEYYKQSRYAEAKDQYLIALRLDTEDRYTGQLSKLATCYTQLGQPDSARVILELAVDKRPESWYERRVLGDLYNRAGRTDEAFAMFRTCVELRPEDWESRRDMKQILQARAEATGEVGDWDAVLEQLDALIELQPESADWPREKDRILAAHYDPEELIASLRRNHEQFPEDLAIVRKLSVALVEYATPETWRESLSLLDRLIAAEPATARHLELKANALEGLGRTDEAVRTLQRQMELQPGKAELPARIGDLLLAKGDLVQARNWALRTQRSFPSSGRGYILMAKVYETAVDRCAGSELKFDDKLVYEMAAREYEKVGDAAFRAVAHQRRQALEEVLPTAEDRFFNKHDQPRGDCYSWLSE
jgi:tetratricopeptide (TPR) repeat protein